MRDQLSGGVSAVGGALLLKTSIVMRLAAAAAVGLALATRVLDVPGARDAQPIRR
jgi:hypothetical protein